MSDPIGTYSFLPWLRRGIANRIGSAGPPAGARATIQVTVHATGEGGAGGGLGQDVNRAVALYGPGDIVGVDPRAIVRVEPRNWITNFESNYLPFIEFYDEDFPWRYTPLAPDPQSGRLPPWLALVVVAKGEWEEAGTLPGAPLPAVTIDSVDLFPPADQLWAWAHVHVNRSLAATATQVVSDDMTAVIPKFEAVLAENPDLASSRIICPRRLQPKTEYEAFLLPAYESGRLAGLGIDPAGAASVSQSAWAETGRAEPTSVYPYYHRWTFHTGTIGDFEYLVRLLQPRKADARVGQRDMDVLRPGSDLPPIANPNLHGVLRLGGALRVPSVNLDATETAEAQKYEAWDHPYPHVFQSSLAELVNLADDYASGDAADPDPLIVPPLYGRWHALTSRLLDPAPTPPARNDNWVNELNLDPRFRVPAAFGTNVVQERQEDYMAAAWEQIGDVLEANRRIRFGQLARGIATRWHVRHFQAHLAEQPGRVLALTAPLHSRVVTNGVTVAHGISTSVVTAAPLAAPMRRIARPGGRLVRSLGFTPEAPVSALPGLVAGGAIAAAPPKVAPAGVVTLDEVVDEMRPSGVPRGLLDLLARMPWLRFVPLILAALLLLLALFTGNPFVIGVAVVVALFLVWLWKLLERWRSQDVIANVIAEENQTPEAVAKLPMSPDFVVSEPGSGVRPSRGTTDSDEAKKYKAALVDLYTTIAASAAASERPRPGTFDVAGLATATLDLVHPSVTIPHRILWGIHLPERVRRPVVEYFREAMAYPVIDEPMYRPLADLSSEHFLPNLNLIPQNSITLLETNQRFIESYMVGLNHEFARELLWREYPTDQRGSYFRQFWDVKGQLPLAGEDPDETKERLRDIRPLHRWSLGSDLGDHDNREESTAIAEEEIVLVIRGELLKKYPTAVVYAQRAVWVRDDDGSIDPSGERRLIDLDPGDEEDPPREKLRMPLYEAKVDPDIYFLGFDLTASVAQGGTGEDPDDDPGWFFVIRERPGDPRFGFDLERDGTLNVWNDLAWSDVAPGSEKFVPVGAGAPEFSVDDPAPGPEPEDSPLFEKKEQYEDDKHLTWGPAMGSSDVAYISYQAPVLVAVHAAEMLGNA